VSASIILPGGSRRMFSIALNAAPTAAWTASVPKISAWSAARSKVAIGLCSFTLVEP